MIHGSSADMAPFALADRPPACPRCGSTDTKKVGQLQLQPDGPAYLYAVCQEPRCRHAFDTREKIK